MLDTSRGTEAVTRVLVDSTDGERTWTTIGVSTNVIEASWEALEDSVVYALLHLRPDPGSPAARSAHRAVASISCLGHEARYGASSSRLEARAPCLRVRTWAPGGRQPGGPGWKDPGRAGLSRKPHPGRPTPRTPLRSRSDGWSERMRPRGFAFSMEVRSPLRPPRVARGGARVRVPRRRSEPCRRAVGRDRDRLSRPATLAPPPSPGQSRGWSLRPVPRRWLCLRRRRASGVDWCSPLGTRLLLDAHAGGAPPGDRAGFCPAGLRRTATGGWLLVSSSG